MLSQGMSYYSDKGQIDSSFQNNFLVCFSNVLTFEDRNVKHFLGTWSSYTLMKTVR